MVWIIYALIFLSLASPQDFAVIKNVPIVQAQLAPEYCAYITWWGTEEAVIEVDLSQLCPINQHQLSDYEHIIWWSCLLAHESGHLASQVGEHPPLGYAYERHYKCFDTFIAAGWGTSKITTWRDEVYMRYVEGTP